MQTASPPLPIKACAPETLAALGPVLCLYRASDTHVLRGLAWARAVQPRVQVDSDGPCEGLTFVDSTGRPCWQLYVLPDSDYWAWDALLTRLATSGIVPCEAAESRSPCEGLRRAALSPRWRACILQLHAVPAARAVGRVAAADVAVSIPGRHAAELLARRAGAFFSLSLTSPSLSFLGALA